MASFVLEEFLGAGALKELSSKFAEDGWDDVPTLKVIGADDMEALDLTDAEKDALELRIYLHNRSLMEYADKLESSGTGLIDLMSMNPADLVSQFGMRKSHAVRFTDTTMACGIQMPHNLVSVPSQRRSSASQASENAGNRSSDIKPEPRSIVKTSVGPKDPAPSVDQTSPSETLLDGKSDVREADPSPGSESNAGELAFEPPSMLRPIGLTKPNSHKGVFKPAPTESSMCGLVKTSNSKDNVTKLSVLEKISLRQLAPEHKNGVDLGTLKSAKELPSLKAANLWANQATLAFCIRRPGCVMCRAEAHQLYARKPIFDALGIQLVAVLLENIPEEVWAFWPRYWGGMVVLDENRDFFRALGGGKLIKENLLTGFLLNPVARLNWKRATAVPGIDYNTKGEGTTKGGLYMVRRGKRGVAYQFVEKNFGDWAPLDEIIQVGHAIREDEDA